MIITSRRSFVTGLIALVAAPAIVRAGSLMPVKLLPISDEQVIEDIKTFYSTADPLEFKGSIKRIFRAADENQYTATLMKNLLQTQKLEIDGFAKWVLKCDPGIIVESNRRIVPDVIGELTNA